MNVERYVRELSLEVRVGLMILFAIGLLACIVGIADRYVEHAIEETFTCERAQIITVEPMPDGVSVRLRCEERTDQHER
jgi:hypothetical protein